MRRETRMADPRMEQERILQRLQWMLDVVSSWADLAPAARAPDVPHGPNMDDVDAAKPADAALAMDAPSGPAASASPELATSADSDGDADTDRAHGSAAG